MILFTIPGTIPTITLLAPNTIWAFVNTFHGLGTQLLTIPGTIPSIIPLSAPNAVLAFVNAFRGTCLRIILCSALGNWFRYLCQLSLAVLDAIPSAPFWTPNAMLAFVETSLQILRVFLLYRICVFPLDLILLAIFGTVPGITLWAPDAERAFVIASFAIWCVAFVPHMTMMRLSKDTMTIMMALEIAMTASLVTSMSSEEPRANLLRLLESAFWISIECLLDPSNSELRTSLEASFSINSEWFAQ
jgi:hypothetical protein